MKLNTLKAGMDKVDVTKVEEVLNSDVARSSEYYKHQEKMNSRARKRLDALVERAVKYRLNPKIIEQWEEEADEEVAKYPETSMDESYLHMDMDAFFASVEIRDNPTYSSLPLAVGSTSMLSTSNYIARRFGVRAGMAGFIALKLCPDLIIVPCHFEKYERIGNEIRQKVLANYDPMFRSFSCDEATLNVTPYCEQRGISAIDVGKQLKAEVLELTGLTCSVGIGPSPILSKIAAEYNKPNGLHALRFDCHEEMRSFLFSLRVRKVPFLGRRSEDLLAEIGILDLGDIYHNRGLLWGLLPRKTTMAYILCPFGIFSTTLRDGDDPLIAEKRALDGSTAHVPVNTEHSISKERTFSPLTSKEELMGIFQHVLVDVLDYFHESHETDSSVIAVTLKFKYHTFDIKQRSIRLDTATKSHQALAETARKVLALEYYPIDIRLLGIKFTLQKDVAEFTGEGSLPHALNAHGEARHEKVGKGMPDSDYLDGNKRVVLKDYLSETDTICIE